MKYRKHEDKVKHSAFLLILLALSEYGRLRSVPYKPWDLKILNHPHHAKAAATKHINVRYWNIARWLFCPVKLTFLKEMESQSLFAKTSCTFVISPCIDPEGKVIDEIWNEGTKHPHVKYYYSGPQECMLTKLKWFSFSYCLEWKKWNFFFQIRFSN